MTSEEMANDDVKKEREGFVKQGIDESRLAMVEVTISIEIIIPAGTVKKRFNSV